MYSPNKAFLQQGFASKQKQSYLCIELTEKDMERTYTFNNSTVRILFGDILDSTADVIVSSDDSRLSMSGGISKNILKKAGPELARDVKK